MVGRLEDTLGYALVRAQRAHRAHVAACLAPLGLHVGQEVLLSVLWTEDGLPQAEVAARLGVEAPTVTKALDRLQRAGLLERRRDVAACDRRPLHGGLNSRNGRGRT